MNFRFAALACAVGLGACAAPPPAGVPTAADSLACALPSNCVNSVGTGGLEPLRYTGTPEQALGLLKATLATFPEAKVVRSDATTIEGEFTTPAGFTDRVDFRVDAAAQRIDFRSRSSFGLYDFGKNRSRMQAFASRFEQQGTR